MFKQICRIVVVLLLTALLFGITAAHAQTTFNVSLNTSPLIGNVNNPFSLDFQLTDGSGIGDGNNTVAISNFQFGGGQATGVPTTIGDVSGNIGSAVAITDTDFFNELYQEFIPGTKLSFDVSLTTNVDVGGTPDEFSFALLDNNLNNIPTFGNGSFVVVDIASTAPVPQIFAADTPYTAIGTPTITFANQSVPEPSSLEWLISTVASLIFVLLRLRRNMKFY